MADQTLSDRLQPSLLDRLTDNEPGRTEERREFRVIDVRRLREIIQRDLAWLLNTNNADTMIDRRRYPNTSVSVLNYGVREVAGEYSTEERAELIRVSIRRAIEVYEPRIRPGTVDVELRAERRMNETIVNFDIRADMWAQPLPIELYLRTEVDMTTGEVSLSRSM
ncbi:type VI secretion system baseplate subunit TssE [Qingshengfaniella alkalisoli]|uniref:Type VI secretion system baseplate subunit TssE n=1 Tax=Qingshengfaniella alkalisoli TaxID=2599296 RepID=A0A5B8IA48_9RHOB|nr:type VI secretion system baseplate subunit TssE [Qingshengfaniella alkalisoli]QDY70929.1 type VI secretion system baseplate subunit TssE [Qingshengfaniella alkalisoli]